MISKIFAADQYVRAVKFASDYEKNGVEEMTVEQEAQIALVVLITGLVVVFAVLIVLTGIIKGYGSIVHGLGQKKKAGKTPEKEAPPALKPVQNLSLIHISQSTGFATMALILPQVKGKRKKGFIIWNVAIYSFMALLIFVMVGSLGSFVKSQLFPVYTMSELAEAGPFSRLDAVFIGVWITGL